MKITHKEKIFILTGGLAGMASKLCASGLGPVNFGKLARHMLKCKPYKNNK